MPINYDHLLNYPIPEVTQTLRWQDVALYNFSIGLGQDPMDEKQLDFLYETRLKAMPSMPVVLASPGFWSRNPDTGIVWQQILHGEQGLVLNVYTEPAWRRRGLGERLLRHLLAWAESRALASLVLHASPDARPLYERLGFVATGNEMRHAGPPY